MTARSAPPRRLRCAVYTRKSSEEGLDMELGSLDAQREACEAYIASQRAEGWVALRDRYDDGGFSGGALDRPALRQLIADIEDGLMDFSKLVEIFARHGFARPSDQWRDGLTLRLGHAALQHDHLDGPADAEHPARLRPVRARG